jgi:hypothetical protein
VKLKELEKRLKAEPDNLGLRVQVAGLMRESGRTTEAVELYRSVALAYRDQGRAQQAVAVCRSILALAPDDVACNALFASLTAPPPPPPSESIEIEIEPGTPTGPPAPARRSSIEPTPLPRPIPHHVADPTSKANRYSPRDLRRSEENLPTSEDADTRPGGETPPETTGLAQAARRISGLIVGKDQPPPRYDDLSAELDTRQRPRIDSAQIRKISLPPPTVPAPLVDIEDITTPPPGAQPKSADSVDITTDRSEALPRDSEDELTKPRDKLPPED